MSDPRVLAVATALPPHRVPQSAARAFARGFFARDVPAIDRLLPAFDNTGIEERRLACPIDWYEEPHTFVEKNAIYRRVALELSTEAATRALEASRIDPSTLGAVVFVSTTGIATPSLDSFLIQRLDVPRSVARVPIWGLGCAGGAAGLARAAELSRGTGRPVLLVSVEVCSTTFVHGDRSKSNLIATALFGDGAAAVVVGPGTEGLALRSGHSHLLDDSEDVMGWELTDEGLKVRFARSIPAVVGSIVPGFVAAVAAEADLPTDAIGQFVVHPGGAKVLHAYEDALQVERSALDDAWAVLQAHGNMSGPTVLFVLERFLRRVPPTGAPGLLLGLGPGFSAEGVLFSW
jgi:alkylresorcinol/alkylpyrone synthase